MRSFEYIIEFKGFDLFVFKKQIFILFLNINNSLI